MREWQVGDPIGDGNDIGVPDIPYMGYLRDDDDEEDVETQKTLTQDELVDLVCRRVLVDKFKEEELNLALKQLLTAEGAYLSDVRFDIGRTDFTITRQNQYFRTDDTFIYIHDFIPSRVFDDWYTEHSYDGLEKNLQIQNAINKIGREFLGFTGGYESTFLLYENKFKLLDKINVKAKFSYGDEDIILYKVDFSDMTLSDDYIII